MITILTSITGQKDKLREMKKWNAEFLAFSDRPKLSPTWTVRPAPSIFVDPRRNSRLPKILSHQYTNSEYTIWVDGNITLLLPPEELIEKYLKNYDIAVYKHPTRSCIYDEATTCAVKGLDDPEVIIEQAKTYEDSGYAKQKGLCECGIIYRRNNEATQQFNNAWWSEYSRHSKRDQIAFMYAVDRVGIPVNIINAPFIEHPDGTITRTDNSSDIVLHNHML